MTISPPTFARANRRHSLMALLALLVLAGAGVGGYFAFRSKKPVIPPIPTEGRDREVVEAIDNARAEVEAKPKSAGAWGRLGMVLFANDMYAECIAFLAEAERLDPSDVRWTYLRSLALFRTEATEGIVVLERAGQAAPRNLTVKLRLAEEYFKLDRNDEADRLFREILAAQPENPRALLGRGQIMARRGRWQDALEPLKAAAEYPTARQSARVALAESYARLGNAAAAEAERRLAAATPADVIWPDSIILELEKFQTGLQRRIDRAVNMLNNNQIAEAAALINQVLEDHPESDEAHLTMARAMIRGGDVDEAEKPLQEAIRLNPKLVDAHFLLGGVQMQRQNYADAERSYRRTIELKPDYARAHFLLGQSQQKQGNRAKAIEAYRDAVRYGPEFAPAQLELGALLLEANDAAGAIPYLQNAIRLDDKSDRARALLERARGKKKP